MSHSELKQATWEANMELHHRGLVLYTWGLSLIHISEPTRLWSGSRMPSSA